MHKSLCRVWTRGSSNSHLLPPIKGSEFLSSSPIESEPLCSQKSRIFGTEKSKYSYLWIWKRPKVETDTATPRRSVQTRCEHKVLEIQMFDSWNFWLGGLWLRTPLVFGHLHAPKSHWCLSYFQRQPLRLDFSSIPDKALSRFSAPLEIS